MVKNKSNKQLIDGLSCILADTYVLYTKTQGYHWNVSGPSFYSYHSMFEEQYEALADAVDTLAERLRALDVTAPGSLSAFLKRTCLKETTGKPNAKGMLKALLHDHERIAKELNALFKVADDAGDEVTMDLFIARKTEHDKFAWMLKSSLNR